MPACYVSYDTAVHHGPDAHRHAGLPFPTGFGSRSGRWHHKQRIVREIAAILTAFIIVQAAILAFIVVRLLVD